MSTIYGNLTEYNWCAPEQLKSATKIMKLNSDFATDIELRGEVGCFECMFLVQGKYFLECFNKILSICSQFDGVKILEEKINLGPKASVKKQLINYTDITVNQTNITDNSDPGTGFDAVAPHTFEHMVVMFSSININNFKETAMIEAFAVHQDQYKCQRCHPVNSSTHIPNSILKGKAWFFQKTVAKCFWWGQEDF